MRIARLYRRKRFTPFLQNWTTTFFITLTLASINCADPSHFLLFWMRSWLIAGVISNVFSFLIFPGKK